MKVRTVLIPKKCLKMWTGNTIKGERRDSVFLVLSELVRRHVESHKPNQKVTLISMNQQLWMSQISVWDEQFRRIIQILRKEKVITVPTGYRTGSSRKYLLNPGFRTFKLVQVEVHNRSTKKSEIPKDPDQRWIYDSLTRTTLPLAGSNQYPVYVTLVSEDLRDKKIRITQSSMGQKLRAFYRHRNVIAKERVFHVVCNLPSEYRRELRIDGKETVEVDISSSHFVLLSGIVKSEGIQVHLPIDRWIRSGRFYEEVNNTIWGVKLDREVVKRLCLKFLDSGSKGRLGNSFVDLRKTNPDISLRFKELRTFFRTNELELTRFIDTENDKKVQTMNSQYQTVGGLLYRLMMKEVEVVIEGIVKWCRLNQIPVISIHDGVIVKKSDFKTRKLKSEFQRIVFDNVGVRPYLKLSDE